MSEKPRRKRRKKRPARETSSQKKALESLDQLDSAEAPKPAVANQPRRPNAAIVAVLGFVVLAAIGAWSFRGGDEPVRPEVETVVDETIVEPPIPADPVATSPS